MKQREDIRQKIIKSATNLFQKKGVHKVTMDDIAHTLSMSKRTLYQIFSDKEELLLACVIVFEQEDRKYAEELKRKATSVLDFLLIYFLRKLSCMDDVVSEFYIDMIKYPRVAKHIELHKKMFESYAVNFLNKGVEEGFFRSDINFYIIVNQLRVGMDIAAQKNMLSQFSRRELFMNTVIPYIRGCSTIKGIDMIDEFIAKQIKK